MHTSSSLYKTKIQSNLWSASFDGNGQKTAKGINVMSTEIQKCRVVLRLKYKSKRFIRYDCRSVGKYCSLLFSIPQRPILEPFTVIIYIL